MSDPRTALERLLGPASVSSDDGIPQASPGSEEEIAATLRVAAENRWRVRTIGLGSKLAWRPPGPRADLALSTRRLAGVVALEPGDGTLTARAGSTVEAVARAAREAGSQLTPRVPRPDRSTLGGVLAAGQSGFDRLRHGPARHHVLGMRVLLADGTPARSGGRLVKNVTGFDLHRLYCGSRGALCVILEVSMRLSAAPESEVVVTAEARDRAEALAKARAALELDLSPLSVRAENVLDARGAWRVHVVLSGRQPFVAWALRTALERIAGTREGVETVERVRDAELAGGTWPPLRVAGRPSRLAAALADGVPGDARMVVEPSIALAEIVDGPESIAPSLRERGLEVTLRGRAAPADEIAHRLKAAFDPMDVLA